MTVTTKDVEKAARLARIRMTGEEIDKYTPQLNNILGLVEQLSELDTDNVEPLANVVDSEFQLREDKETEDDQQSSVLSNAPEQTSGFFVVPKVVE